MGRRLPRRPLHGRRRGAVARRDPDARGHRGAGGAGRGHDAGAAGAARARHHLPAPGGAGEVGGHRRPRVSGGRLLLGVGAGWQENEHEQYGIPLGSPRERIDRFEEALRVLKGLLREPTTTVEGEHYRRDRRHRRAEAGAVAAADPRRRQGQPHAAGRRPPRRRVEHVVDARGDGRARRRCSTRRCEKEGRDPATMRALARRRCSSSSTTTRKAADLVARVAPRPAVGGLGRAHRRVRGGGGATPASTRSSSPTSRSAPAPQRADAMDTLIEQVAPRSSAELSRRAWRSRR